MFIDQEPLETNRQANNLAPSSIGLDFGTSNDVDMHSLLTKKYGFQVNQCAVQHSS